MTGSLAHPRHRLRAAAMLAETAGLAAALAALGLAGLAGDRPWLVVVAGVLQGFWFQRVYCVGHEAAHRKLFPDDRLANDVAGQLALFLILVPLPIFRKIHRFHHARNRFDDHTSALDVFVVPAGAGRLRRAWCHVVWYAAVFGGGWFVHSLVSIVLFLFLPVSIARKVSPAFAGWTWRDQVGSAALFALPLAAWGVVGALAGWAVPAALLGLPLAVFAWVYSAQLYVYHYATTRGPRTAFHARRLHGGPLLSWWLLNLNEHDTHHRRPAVVWYALPSAGEPLPPEFAANQDVHGFVAGVVRQLRGPTIVEAP